MIEAYAIHDTVSFTRSLGSVLRSILDFNLYTSVAGSLEASPSPAELWGQSKLPEQPKWERQAAMEEKLAYAREKLE